MGFVRDGKLYLHVENDGWAFLRHGPEASEQEVTLDELAARHPWSGVARWLLDALIEQERALKIRTRSPHVELEPTSG
jgi:hypothetical protein